MAIAQLSPQTVRVENGTVIFDGFADTDRQVVETIGVAVDPDGCAHHLLHLGAQHATLATGTGGLIELEARVGARLDVLAGTTQATVASGLAALTEQSRALFSPDGGEVTTALKEWRAELDCHLSDLFDPEHRRSLIATMEHSLTGVLDAYSGRLTAATDPNLPESPAGRLLAQLERDASGLRTEMAALTLAVGAERGRVVEHARSAVKGTEFERIVLDAMVAIAAPHGDLVEHVGRVRGAKGSKAGDICVTLCDDVPGEVGRYVLEVKDRRLTLQSTWRELDAAMANWEAAAAVAVFAAGELAPTPAPFFYAGERAVVVLDRDDPDPAALGLACMFARWVVRRRSAPAGTGPDPERMAAGIDRIQRSLARVSTIRRNLSSAANATGEARQQLDELASEIRVSLAELSEELEA